MQPTIALIYFSGSGNTAKLAQAARQGAQDQVRVVEHRILGTDVVDGRFENEAALELVDAAVGVLFGSPTYMGGPAAEFKAFADASSSRWSQRTWRNKLAGGFTSGSCPGGDQAHTLAYFSVLAAQHGMVWCNLDIPGGEDPLGRNRLGTQVGVASQTINGELHPGDLLTAQYLGHRIATLTKRFSAAAAF